MPLQKLPEEAVDTTEEPGMKSGSMRHWIQGGQTGGIYRRCFRAVLYTDQWKQILLSGRNAAAGKKLASVSFQDVDNDRDTDIILIVQCHNDRGIIRKNLTK